MAKKRKKGRASLPFEGVVQGGTFIPTRLRQQKAIVDGKNRITQILLPPENSDRAAFVAQCQERLLDGTPEEFFQWVHKYAADILTRLPGRPSKVDTPLLDEFKAAKAEDPGLPPYKFLMARSGGDSGEYERLKKQLQREKKMGDKN